MMAQISKLSFILYTMGLLFVWLAVIVSAAGSNAALEKPLPPLSTPGTWRSGGPSVERKNERNCKALCEHCGCLGFYCGEECLCECNNDDSDTECIGTMQSNARKLDIPFEILIQGPTCNRFVRNALQFEQNSERRSCPVANARNKRSTVTIYKPTHSKQSVSALLNALDISAKDDRHGRKKRAVEHIAWFNDLANNLVRPAPFIGRGRKSATTTPEPQSIVQKRRQSKPYDFSWYSDPNPQKLVQPAPIHKRPYSTPKEKKQRPSRQQVTERERKPLTFETEDMIKAAMDAVERFPRVLQDSVSNIADRNMDDVYKFNFMNPADILPNPLSGKEFGDILRRLSQETLAFNEVTSTTPPPPAAAPTASPSGQPPQGIFLPWLRNRMMLRRRIQERLNRL